jgi:Flp pilus assembly protein TadG
MRRPFRNPDGIIKVLRRFRRDRHGSAAVEFAFIAPLFFMLLFAIIETALMFFAGQVLETITQDSARLMLTNQAQDGGMTQPQFRTALCGRITALFGCTGVFITVKAYPPGTLIPQSDLADPISGGAFVDNSTYQVPRACDTGLVRVFYQWPLYVTKLGYDMANITQSGSKYKLLSATAAFRVEPNSTGCPTP